ncbi:MAG: trimethylamine methyltransferase family protein [Candidatus Brocadiae bacterium]|nr:trimethylamine methyltransferase family protein [Candidatus Brocadiia bacterium]
MRVNLKQYGSVQFRALSDDQIEQIFLGALELLESPGTRIHEAEARQLLEAAGAKIEGDLARIPSGLVKEMLTSVPPRVALANRDGERKMVLESHRIYYGTGSDCPFIIDADTGERRKFTKRDIEDAARVVDACPNLDFHMSLGLTSDVPTHSYDRHQAAAMLRNTIKPLVLTAMSREGLSDIAEMYYLVRGGRDAFEVNPGFIVYLEPITPLVHGQAAMEKLIFAAERRIPAIYTPCPMAGATAPVTLAGALVVCVAEFLAGMVVSQLKRRGAPLIMGGVISPMDMRTTILTYGSPELHLMSAALTDIAHSLQIPVFSTAGCSDSKILDEQAAAEAALSIMAAGLSGANLIHDVGYLESALVGSHEMVVLSDEIIGMVKRFLSGVRVEEQTLALSVIKEVGPGGNFLAHEHTARNMRSELWYPKLMDRDRYSAWRSAGSKSMGDRVRERVAEILATHQVPPLPAETDAGIDRILSAADEGPGEGQTDIV